MNFRGAVPCVAFGALVAVASAQSSPKPLGAADVIALSQAGLSDQIIIAKIRAAKTATDLSTEDMLKLKKAQISDAVIAALIDPTASASGAGTTVNVNNPLLPAGHASGATTGTAGDPNDPLSPHDSGIYVYSTDHDHKPTMMLLERTAYQGAKTGGMFTSAMTYGIAKAKSKAIISGSRASIRVGESHPVFYFYFDEKAGGIGGNSFFAAQNISNPNQFALIHLATDKNSRQAEIGQFSMWGASSGNNRKDMVMFKSERLKPGLYKVTPEENMKAGEYCFMTAPATTSSYAGMAGTTSGANLFDFGIDQ